MTGVWTPQWLYRHITIDGGETIRLDPGAFMNNQPWPLHLKWLSLTGHVNADDSGDFQGTVGGVARRLQFEFSMSQKGDISTELLTGSTVFVDSHMTAYGRTCRYDFSPAFPLGPEEGIVAEATNLDETDNYDSQAPSIMFTGLRKERRFGGYVPAHLGGHYHGDLGYADSVTMPSTDLYNNGEDTLWLRQMLLETLNPVEGNVDVFPLSDRNRIAWRVNPNAGIEWMPNPEPIPVGNIAPFTTSVFDVGAYSMGVWVFPKESELKPRQRFGVKINNLANKTQQIGLCLHGIMEVK